MGTNTTIVIVTLSLGFFATLIAIVALVIPTSSQPKEILEVALEPLHRPLTWFQDQLKRAKPDHGSEEAHLD